MSIHWNVVKICDYKRKPLFHLGISHILATKQNTQTSNSQDLELYLYLKSHREASTKQEILFSALFPYLKPHSGASVNRGNKFVHLSQATSWGECQAGEQLCSNLF